MSGANLPQFQSVQLDFAAHIRNPEKNPRPSDVEERRMQIYLGLFFRNIESFIASAFPVAKEILGADRWLALARRFVDEHASSSPYFLQISEEFLTFVDGLEDGAVPPYFLELCHYEWVELSLDVAQAQVGPAFDPDGSLTDQQIVSAAIRPLTYRWPVHLIGVEHQPEREEITHLIVYRREDDTVHFMESNAVTHRLLELLAHEPPPSAIGQLRAELAEAGREVVPEKFEAQAYATISELRDKGILLGTSVTGD